VQRAALPITLFDNVVDRTSIRPRHHAFEKMISGMCELHSRGSHLRTAHDSVDLGELVRAVLIHLIDSLHLFDGYSSDAMNEQYAFDTAYVSAVLDDKAPEAPSSPTRAVILQTMGMKKEHVSDQDLKTVRRVCEIVGRRAGRLSSVAIAAVIQHTGHDQRPQKESIDVGVDGSVYEHLPHFEEW
jgi:hexokinase